MCTHTHAHTHITAVQSILTLTSQIAYEVVEAHFAVRFDVGGVHVCVEEDDGESQDEDGVWVVKLLHHIRVTHAIPLTVESKEQRRGM